MAQSFNLSALGRELHARGQHSELASQIHTQASTASRLADLLQAAELVAVLDQLEDRRAGLAEDGPKRDFITTTQGAILAQIIVLYVRATSKGDKARALTFNVEDILSSDQLEMHQYLRASRNRAIAHFDGDTRQNWHADCLIMVKHDNGDWHFGSPYSRTTYRRGVHLGLKILLDVLVPAVEVYSRATMDTLNSTLLRARRADANLDALIDGFPFDGMAFYGPSPEGAAAFNRALEGGEGHFAWLSRPASTK